LEQKKVRSEKFKDNIGDPWQYLKKAKTLSAHRQVKTIITKCKSQDEEGESKNEGQSCLKNK